MTGCVLTHPSSPEATAPDIIYSSRYTSLRLAMLQWAKSGGVLSINQNHDEIDNIYVVLQPGKTYRLTTEGAPIITYIGQHFHWFIRILGKEKTPFIFEGNLTIDGKNNVNIPFWLQYDLVGGTNRRDCIFDGNFICKNARMKRGFNRINGDSNSTYESACIIFSGGFDKLELRGLQAISATRESNLTVVASKGSRGIVINGFIGTERSSKHIIVSDFVVEDISAEDIPGTIDVPECDGLLIFKSAELSASETVVERGRFKNCLGRAIKLYSPGGGGVAKELLIERSNNLASVIDINFQHGDGLVEDVEFRYFDKAHGTKNYRLATTPISFATSYSRPKEFPFRNTTIRNVQIIDTTGVRKAQLIGLDYIKDENTPRKVWFENILDKGASDVLFRPAALGRYQDVTLHIQNVDVNLEVAACETDDPLERLTVIATDFVNRSPVDRPVVTTLDGKVRTASYGHWVSSGVLEGFTQKRDPHQNASEIEAGFIHSVY